MNGYEFDLSFQSHFHILHVTNKRADYLISCFGLSASVPSLLCVLYMENGGYMEKQCVMLL